jgi:hypothetical protein
MQFPRRSFHPVNARIDINGMRRPRVGVTLSLLSLFAVHAIAETEQHA